MKTIDKELQKFADDSQKELDLELEAYFAAVLVAIGSIQQTQALTPADILSTITPAKDEFLTATEATILATAGVAKYSLDKMKKINSNAVLGSESISIANAFTSGLSAELKTFIESKSVEISNSVYTQIIAGNSSTKEIVDTVRASFASAGLGMKNFRGLKNLITTKIFEMEALIFQKLAETFGVKKFKYVGGLISTTRPWCEAHDGKTLTSKEIQDWRKSDWSGKKDGDPFVVRGGWNCRHHWEPVK